MSKVTWYRGSHIRLWTWVFYSTTHGYAASFVIWSSADTHVKYVYGSKNWVLLTKDLCQYNDIQILRKFRFRVSFWKPSSTNKTFFCEFFAIFSLRDVLIFSVFVWFVKMLGILHYMKFFGNKIQNQMIREILISLSVLHLKNDILKIFMFFLFRQNSQLNNDEVTGRRSYREK